MTGELRDGFDRVADDLRLSVTDRCNFRCRYCMPAEGLSWLGRDELLSFDEILHLARILQALGVRTIRLTGGEPLVRHGLDGLVRALSAMGFHDLSVTTNGFLLEEKAGGLARAGLTRVNVSLDSLMRHRFTEITRRDGLDQVMRGLDAARRAGLGPVKVNCVVVRGTNDDEVVDFAELARATGYEVRFIELMPLDADRSWSPDRLVPAKEVLETIHRVHPLIPLHHGPEPAKTYRFADGAPGRVGVIPSVTEPFCADCNRIRLTADGHLRTCLFSVEETDLRSMLRNGADDDEVAAAIRAAVVRKWAGHAIGSPDFLRPQRSMSMIGG